MKKFNLLKSIMLLCMLMVGLGAWAEEGDVLKTYDTNSNTFTTGYARKTGDNFVFWGQKNYFGANNATNHGNLKPTAADLPVVKAQDNSATTSTTGLYYLYNSEAVSNVGAITISFSAISGSSTVNAYVVTSSTAAANGSATWTKVDLDNESTSAQGANVATAGTYTFKLANTETSAKYYGIVFVTSSYWRATGLQFKLIEGATTPANPYTVTFVAGINGTCNCSDIENHQITESSAGAGVTLPDVTANTGYIFKGWSTSSSPTSADAGVTGDTYKPSSNCTLYAYYVPAYTLTITQPAAGGTLTVSDANGTLASGATVGVGTNLTCEVTNIPAGKRFSRFYANWDNEGSAYKSTNPATFNNIPTTDITECTISVTYQDLDQYTINYMVNGVNTNAQENVYEGTALAFPTPSDIAGKSFVGWSETEIAETTNTAPSFVNTTGLTATANKTYYAVFAAQSGNATPQTVTWNINGVETAAGNAIVNTALTTSSVSPETETGVWTAVSTNSSYAATSNSKAQLGSGSYAFLGSISLSGTSIPSTATITNIALTATSSATDAHPYTISATVNGTAFGTADNISSGSANCSWTGNVNGNQIALAASCGYNKNIVISALAVTYTNATYSDYCTTVAAPAPTSTTVTFAATDGTSYYATFSCDHIVALDEVFVNDAATCMAEVKAYTVSVDGSGNLTLTDLNATHNVGNYTYIPANTGILLKYTLSDGTFDGEVTLNYADEWDGYLDPVPTNMLRASSVAMENSGYMFYKLAYKDSDCTPSTLGFYWGADGGAAYTCSAGKAYLAVPTSPGAKAGFSFNEDETTGIENVENTSSSNVAYNLAGQRVNANAKGIVIINGKKVLNK